MFPGSTSDCLAFEGMSLYEKLQQDSNFLAPGLCFFGDNAYINALFMATPFAGTSGGTKDAYNFYHSQVRIRIECAFGMLTQRFGILRKAIPVNIPISRAVALVMALAKLHNFCIDETDADGIPSISPADDLEIEMQGGVPLETTQMLPEQLLHVGHHFDDIDRNSHRRRTRQYQSAARVQAQQQPRDRLHEQVANANLRRPTV